MSCDLIRGTRRARRWKAADVVASASAMTERHNWTLGMGSRVDKQEKVFRQFFPGAWGSAAPPL